jgi:hypothetical protein
MCSGGDADGAVSPSQLTVSAGDMAADHLQQHPQQQQMPTLGSLELVRLQQQQQQEHLEGVEEDGFRRVFFADREQQSELQSDDMLLVGKYLQLPLHSSHGSSSSNGSNRVSGFAAAATGAEGNAVPLGSVPHRRRKVALVHYHAVAGGLSVATS